MADAIGDDSALGLFQLEGFGAGPTYTKGHALLFVGDLTRYIAQSRYPKRFSEPEGSPKRFQVKLIMSELIGYVLATFGRKGMVWFRGFRQRKRTFERAFNK